MLTLFSLVLSLSLICCLRFTSPAKVAGSSTEEEQNSAQVWNGNSTVILAIEPFTSLKSIFAMKRFVVLYCWVFLRVEPEGRVKIQTTSQNTQRYYTTERLVSKRFIIQYAKLLSQCERFLSMFSGVQIPRDVCTRLGCYLYSTKHNWIINMHILHIVLSIFPKCWQENLFHNRERLYLVFISFILATFFLWFTDDTVGWNWMLVTLIVKGLN